MNLRILVKADGSQVMQIQVGVCNLQPLWQDVPKVHEEPKRTIDYLKELKYKMESLPEDALLDIANKYFPKEPEAPKKPREFWLQPNGVSSYSNWDVLSYEPKTVFIHVVECPKGYKLVSRDDLRESLMCHPDYFTMGYFDKLCNRLGFDE